MSGMASPPDSSQKKIDLLVVEYKMLCDEIRMHSDFLLRNNQFLFAMADGLMGISFLKDGVVQFDYLPAIVPSLLFLYLMFHLMSMHVLSGLTKARKGVELRINRIAGESLMQWESFVGDLMVRHRMSGGMIAGYGFLVFILALFAYFAVCAVRPFGALLAIAHAAQLVVIVTAMAKWTSFELHGETPQLSPNKAVNPSGGSGEKLKQRISAAAGLP